MPCDAPNDSATSRSYLQQDEIRRPAMPMKRALRLLRLQLFSLRVLLVFVPLSFVAALLGWHDVTISAFSFLAIIPLSALISDASDAIANRWGELIGGLVNATFGNTVELIVGILAVSLNELKVAQSIMLGSILSDILLVQGLCIIAATRSTGVIIVNSTIVDTLSSLMLVASMALVLPTALYANFPGTRGGIDINKKILTFSRATVTVLLIVYVTYLYFQLKTHSSLFMEDTKCNDDTGEAAEDNDSRTRPIVGSHHPDDCEHGVGDADDTPPMPNVSKAIAVLAVSGVLVGKLTHYFMLSLDGMATTLSITKTFVAMIVIPLASNAPELMQVVAAAKKEKIDFAISVIVGSILQITLFVLPILVLVGWIIDRPMDLYFEPSQTYILLFAVVLVNQVLQDRHYTYLHGVMLLCVYAIIASAYFVTN